MESVKAMQKDFLQQFTNLKYIAKHGTGNALSFVIASGVHTMFVNEIEERS